MDRQTEYWFPAKRIGWGWGLPHRWEGWAALVLYGGSVALVFFLASPASHPVAFVSSMLLSTAMFVVVCWFKGEPPHENPGDR